MPITLPQLTRREFLKRAAIAGAVAALAPTSYAGLFGKSRDKHTFALFSDTHIGPGATDMKGGVNMADNMAAVIREIVALKKNPAAVIVSGDLALSSGVPAEYVTFGKTIHPVRAAAPLHLLLGNHDHRENFWKALPKDAVKSKSVSDKQCAILSSERANWFLLDSLEVALQTPGALGASQIEWLERELNSRRDKPAIIVLHHNLGTAGGIEGLKDTAALAALFKSQPQVKALIYGHTHNWEIKKHESGVHLINLPPTAYVFGKGRPNGWVRVTLAGDGMEIELRALDPKHPEHAKVQQLKWRTA